MGNHAEQIQHRMDVVNKAYAAKLRWLHIVGYIDEPLDHHILFHDQLSDKFFGVCQAHAGDIAAEHRGLLTAYEIVATKTIIKS